MYNVKGKELYLKGKVHEKFGSHTEAIQAAEDRAKHDAEKRSTVAVTKVRPGNKE